MVYHHARCPLETPRPRPLKIRYSIEHENEAEELVIGPPVFG